MNELKKLLENAGIAEAANNFEFEVYHTLSSSLDYVEKYAGDILKAAFENEGQLGIINIEADIAEISINARGQIIIKFDNVQTDSEEIGMEELYDLRVQVGPSGIRGLW